jgi:hypothetical protein
MNAAMYCCTLLPLTLAFDSLKLKVKCDALHLSCVFNTPSGYIVFVCAYDSRHAIEYLLYDMIDTCVYIVASGVIPLGCLRTCQQVFGFAAPLRCIDLHGRCHTCYTCVMHSVPCAHTSDTPSVGPGGQVGCVGLTRTWPNWRGESCSW